jgi:hypothetical protein
MYRSLRHFWKFIIIGVLIASYGSFIDDNFLVAGGIIIWVAGTVGFVIKKIIDNEEDY